MCTSVTLSSIVGFEDTYTRKMKQRTFSDYYEHLHVISSGSMGTVSCIKQNYSTISRWSSILHRINKQAHRSKKKILPTNFVNEGTLHDCVTHMQLFAVKTIKKSKKHNPKYINEMRNEISILRTVDHINVIHIHDIFEREQKIALVLQLCTGGDLTARCPCKTEDKATSIIYKIISAVAHMHHKGIVHRDLKLENIMFEDCTPESEIKIIDFGLSSTFTPGEILLKRVGSPYTMAPELIACSYTSKVDLWSIGVITYIVLTNRSPFNQTNLRILFKEILSCKYNFNHPVWRNISNEAEDFISNLLVLDPNDRMDANEALQHPWLQKCHPKEAACINNDNTNMMYILYHNMKLYFKYDYVKRASLMIMSQRLKSPNFNDGKNNVVTMRNLFRIINTSGNGCITFAEFKKSFLPFANRSNDDELYDMFKAMDFNNDNTITYTELLAPTLEYFNCVDQTLILDTFDRFDIDCKGYITIEKVNKVLEKYFEIDKAEDVEGVMIDECHQSVETKFIEKKHKITFKKFLSYFQ